MRPEVEHEIVLTAPAGPVSRAERSRLTAVAFEQAATTSCDAERQRLLNAVIELNMPVAESVAVRYRWRGIDDDDLRQVACVGLIKAVTRFEVRRGLDFLTFAVPTIRGEVQRHFRDHGWMVRPPRRIQQHQKALQVGVEELTALMGREPSVPELLSHLDMSRRDYDQAMAAYGAFHPVSLDAPVSEDSASCLGELILAADPEDAAADARAALTPLVRELSDRERRVLFLRYQEDRTQREIGEEFGVSQMQVSRILSNIHRRLRERLADVDVEGDGLPH